MPCRSVGAASMRQPSITTSCVAEEKATKNAQPTVHSTDCDGSPEAMPMRPRIMPACESSIQPRRRPVKRDKSGTSRRSIIGAHKNFKL